MGRVCGASLLKRLALDGEEGTEFVPLRASDGVADVAEERQDGGARRDGGETVARVALQVDVTHDLHAQAAGRRGHDGYGGSLNWATWRKAVGV